MSMSHAYGVPDRKAAERTLHRALDIGYNFFDTAALYGFGKNEQLLGEVISPRRNEFVLASKCGLIRGEDGKRSVNAQPDIIRKTCEQSLKNLRTDHIDLYYLHRVDPKVPLEDQIGMLGQLVTEGKIRSVGMSEVAAETLRKAHAIHPIAALQSEYSLWTRNPEHQVLDTCRELGIAFVAFSPLGRGFLCANLSDPDTLVETDLRRSMPRFQGDNFVQNLALLEPLKHIAAKNGCSPAQLALAWLLSKAKNIVPIPGTQNVRHAEENFSAIDIRLSARENAVLENAINASTVRGERYNRATLATMET